MRPGLRLVRIRCESPREVPWESRRKRRPHPASMACFLSCASCAGVLPVLSVAESAAMPPAWEGARRGAEGAGVRRGEPRAWC